MTRGRERGLHELAATALREKNKDSLRRLKKNFPNYFADKLALTLYEEIS